MKRAIFIRKRSFVTGFTPLENSPVDLRKHRWRFLSLTGFTLIDLSITIALIFVICTGMLGVFSRGYGLLRKAKQKTTAYNLAREVLETYSDWDSIPASDISLTPYAVLNNTAYNLKLTVSSFLTYNTAELRRIDAVISWNVDAVRTVSITLFTLKANY